MGLLLASASTADAKVLITHGDAIKHVSDLKPEAVAEYGPDVKVGYLYQQFGIFFLEIWTWDGKFVLYEGDNYNDELADDALANIAATGLSKPWNYTFPPGFLVILVAAMIGLALFLHGRKQAKEVAIIMGDQRYQQAFNMMVQSHQEGAPPPSTFDEAVAFLQQQGVSPDEARQNLQKVVDAQDDDDDE